MCSPSTHSIQPALAVQCGGGVLTDAFRVEPHAPTATRKPIAILDESGVCGPGRLIEGSDFELCGHERKFADGRHIGIELCYTQQLQWLLVLSLASWLLLGRVETM